VAMVSPTVIKCRRQIRLAKVVSCFLLGSHYRGEKKSPDSPSEFHFEFKSLRSHLLFSCQTFECSAIHLAASCSAIKPLITSVSPSGQRTSITQPDPGFFRATKVGRCSDIPQICAYCTPVQDTVPLPNASSQKYLSVAEPLLRPSRSDGNLPTRTRPIASAANAFRRRRCVTSRRSRKSGWRTGSDCADWRDKRPAGRTGPTV
jgi:hypothetical protein